MAHGNEEVGVGGEMPYEEDETGSEASSDGPPRSQDEEMERMVAGNLAVAAQALQRYEQRSSNVVALPPLHSRYLDLGIKFDAQRDAAKCRKEAAEVKFRLQRMFRDLNDLDKGKPKQPKRRAVTQPSTKGKSLRHKRRPPPPPEFSVSLLTGPSAPPVWKRVDEVSSDESVGCGYSLKLGGEHKKKRKKARKSDGSRTHRLV
jgi:hypothetical protein